MCLRSWGLDIEPIGMEKDCENGNYDLSVSLRICMTNFDKFDG
jgi:hypothetical protein